MANEIDPLIADLIRVLKAEEFDGLDLPNGWESALGSARVASRKQLAQEGIFVFEAESWGAA